MYFKEKGDTNIDKEFAKEKKKGPILDFKNLNPKKLIFIIGSIIVVFIVIFIIVSMTSKKPTYEYVIELNGEESININLGDEYIEPGYTAYYGTVDVTNDVQITSTVDIQIPGEYEILYSVGNANVIRRVNVVENIDATYIHLLGEKNVYLEIGEKYEEPGYRVYDTKEQNLTEEVTITGSVDTTKEGTYRLTYSVVNSRNQTISVVRTIKVVKNGQKPKN